MYAKKGLTLADAKGIAAAAEAEALKNGWSVSIAIVDDGGNLLYLQRLDDAPVGSVAVAQEKARTAFLFGGPTKAIEDMIAGGRLVMLALPGVTPIRGGLPLRYEGRVVGAIGVSGAQSSQDEQVAQAGVQAASEL